MLLELLLFLMSENDVLLKCILSKELVTEGKVIVDIESEATILRDGQLVSFTQQCPYSFGHDGQVHLGELQDGVQPPTLCL